MANSIVKLTLESNQYERGLKNAQKSLNDFTKAIGVSAKSLSGMALAAGAVSGALKVAKDAFFKNEQQLDEWGRVVQSCEGLYNGFLNTLNSGDFSGFFQNIDNIIKASREAYNAIDELATYNAFNRMNVGEARANMSEAIGNYRLGQGSKDDVVKAVDNLKKELSVRQEKEWQAYIASVKEIAQQRGANPDDVVKLLGGSYVDFQNVKASYKPESFSKKNVAPMFGGGTVSGAMMGVNFNTRVSKAPGTDEERLSNFARSLNDTELDKLQAMGEQAKNTKREIADLDKQLARVLNGRGSAGSGSTGGGRSGGGGGGSKTELTEMQTLQKTIRELEQEYVKLGGITSEEATKRKDEIRTEISENEKRIDQIKLLTEQSHGKLMGGEGLEVPLTADITSMGSLQQSINEIREELEANPIVIPIESTEKDVKKIAQAASITADVVGSIGDAFNAIEDPAAKVAGTVMQAIASVAMGYAQATVAAAQTGNPWVWLAFAASGLATMITMISTIHSQTGYAEGGIVKGNSYSGDNVYAGNAWVNSGELVLNKAQQNSLANTLTGNGLGNINLRAVLQGEQILLAVDRTLKRQGKGELATFK